MQFQKGQSGNPKGKPRGTVGGRARALQWLDALLAQAENEEALKRAMQEEFSKSPMKFFTDIVMPLLPREQLIKTENVEKAPVRIIVEQAEATRGN